MAADQTMTATAGKGARKTQERVSQHVKPEWWKECSVYQIYPSSFKDSNGDGVGDIPGIIEKLDYIKQLGVDMVWICPIYKSPKVDMGYDVEDYRDIDPQYGSMADVERLIQGLHERGLKFLMDLVVNHTSDQVRTGFPARHVNMLTYLSMRGSSLQNPPNTTNTATGTFGESPNTTWTVTDGRQTTGALTLVVCRTQSRSAACSFFAKLRQSDN